MRMTLGIDDGVLAAAKALAHNEGTSIGTALSQLARRGLAAQRPVSSEEFPVIPLEGPRAPITLELVNEYRDCK
jgi:hypothetical protein